MTATVLVSGRLLRDPEQKTSKNGNAFTTATIKVGDGTEVVWWKVLCFSESASAELLTLRAGDGVAVSGGFKVEPFEKGGVQRLGYTVFAEGVLSAKRKKREQASQRRGQSSATEAAPAPTRAPIVMSPDDGIPF